MSGRLIVSVNLTWKIYKQLAMCRAFVINTNYTITLNSNRPKGDGNSFSKVI